VHVTATPFTTAPASSRACASTTRRAAGDLPARTARARLFDSCRIMRMEVPYTKSRSPRPSSRRCAATDSSPATSPARLQGRRPDRAGRAHGANRAGDLRLRVRPHLGQAALEHGVDVMVSSWRRAAPAHWPAWPSCGNYLNSQFIAMEAADSDSAKHRPGRQRMVSEAAARTSSWSTGRHPHAARQRLHPDGITRECVLTLAKELGHEVREQASRATCSNVATRSSSPHASRSPLSAPWDKIKIAPARAVPSPPASRKRSTASSVAKRRIVTTGSRIWTHDEAHMKKKTAAKKKTIAKKKIATKAKKTARKRPSRR